MIRLILCGDESVGKTSILSRFENNNCPQQYYPTIAIDFKQFHTKNAHFHICDTSGKSKHEQIVTNQFKDVHVILFVFDLQNEDTLESILLRWMKLSLWDKRVDTFGYLVGNKSDIKGENKDDIYFEFAKKNNLTFVKTSALNGDGVYDLFIQIGDIVNTRNNKLLSEGKPGLFTVLSKFEDLLVLEEDEDETTKKGCCCRRRNKFSKI